MTAIIEADLVDVKNRKTKDGNIFQSVKLGKDYTSIDVLSFNGVQIPSPAFQKVRVEVELQPRGFNYSLSLISIEELNF